MGNHDVWLAVSVEFGDDDPKTRCKLSGSWEMHGNERNLVLRGLIVECDAIHLSHLQLPAAFDTIG